MEKCDKRQTSNGKHFVKSAGRINQTAGHALPPDPSPLQPDT